MKHFFYIQLDIDFLLIHIVCYVALVARGSHDCLCVYSILCIYKCANVLTSETSCIFFLDWWVYICLQVLTLTQQSIFPQQYVLSLTLLWTWCLFSFSLFFKPCLVNAAEESIVKSHLHIRMWQLVIILMVEKFDKIQFVIQVFMGAVLLRTWGKYYLFQWQPFCFCLFIICDNFNITSAFV